MNAFRQYYAEAYLREALLALTHLEGAVKQGLVGPGLLHSLKKLIFTFKKVSKFLYQAYVDNLQALR